MKKFIISTLCCLFTFLCLFFVGCNNNNTLNFDDKVVLDYEITFYKNIASIIKENVRADNLVKYAYKDGWTYSNDDNCPTSKSFIVASNDDYQRFFSSNNTIDIDFNAELLILYTFSVDYNDFYTKIIDVKLEEGLLKIEYGTWLRVCDESGYTPRQVWYAVKIEKLDFANVENKITYINVKTTPDRVKPTSNYNPTLYDFAWFWIREDFRQQNLLKGAIYKNNEESESWFDENLHNTDNCPKERNFLITNETSFNQTFVANIEELDVDFTKEILIVYTFVTEYGLPIKVKDIKLNKTSLNINFIMEHLSGVGGAKMPYQRWLVLKMDKENFNDFNCEIANVTYN